MQATLPRTRAELAALLRAKAVPEPLVRQLVDRARPALVLSTQEAEEHAIAVGASKFGGLPDLPAGQGWPHRPPYGNAEALAARYRANAADTLRRAAKPGFWATAEQARSFADEDLARADAAGRAFPLAFMAQLDLSTLAKEPGFDRALPDHGRLLVFYDWWLNPAPFEPQSRPGWRVVWDTTPAAQLVRHAAPEALTSLCTEDWTTIFPPNRVTPESAFCFVPPAGWIGEDIGAEDSALEEVVEAAEELERNADIRNQLAGWPQSLQNGLQHECQLASNGLYCGMSDNYRTQEAMALLEAAGDWQLVLQIGEELLGNGALYVMMREADLHDRAFDRAWVVYQCT